MIIHAPTGREKRPGDVRRVVLAFSGGLDTSFCALYLQEHYGAQVVTATVDTGGFGAAELRRIAAQARRLGSVRHYSLNARQKVYDGYITNIIRGNLLRGGVYPLSVAAERIVQAAEVARVAAQEKADAVAHGSTGAGNDQVRFDVAFGVLAPGVRILTPIRDLGLSRLRAREYLKNHGFNFPEKRTKYSINAGLCGTTIGGGATHDPWLELPEDAFTYTKPPEKAPERGVTLTLTFKQGLPVRLDGRRMSGPDLLAHLNRVGAEHGVGRGVHVGDTTLGIKGRIAFEAPGPVILIRAHRELEKLVLTKWEAFWKGPLCDFYGNLLHEGLYFDPVMRDIEAFLEQSQTHVEGDVRIRLHRGLIDVLGARSRHSLMRRDVASYGEETRGWTADEARGFCKIFGLQSVLSAAAGRIKRPTAERKPRGETTRPTAVMAAPRA